ncbi:MAG: hypothetical protein AVO33_11010 [delta proteobacterium ML8_F1]|nr:MAG: hypothetical protein AVO33_11010 [delta proteobacterium ML8_F1]
MKPLDISHKEILKPYFDAFEIQASEISFTNLFMWRHKYNFHYEIIEDFLYLINVKNEATRCYSQPIGDYSRLDALKKSLQTLMAREESLVFKKVDGTFVEVLKTLSLDHELKEEREAFDYLYDFEALKYLPGKDYHKKKNHVNKFMKTYGDWEYLALDRENLSLARRVNDAWFQEVRDQELLSEKEAIEEALNHFGTLGFSGGIITLAHEPVAFTLGERLNRDTLVIHIEKALGPYQGLYAMINQQFLLHQETSYSRINREQDLGIEGLRRAKLSYRPIGFIEKYIVKIQGADHECQSL